MTGTPGRLHGVKKLIRTVLPLNVRKPLALWLGKRNRLKARSWWIQELLRDYCEADPNGYHRFLWSHHLAYAETYEIDLRFGADRLHPSRHLLFQDLGVCLGGLGRDSRLVGSVFEVGASLGYNLRFLETEMFTSAETLEGCDIDAYAVETGQARLTELGSRVRLMVADMGDLNSALSSRDFDVIICAGVLMYLGPEDAERVVSSILRHTQVVAAFAGLSHPEQDNQALVDSEVREADGSYIHNIDGMVARSGGRVVQRRWEGDRQLEGNTLYFVFATAPLDRTPGRTSEAIREPGRATDGSGRE